MAAHQLYNNHSSLIRLYHTNVAVSNEVHQLRSEVRAMKDSIYEDEVMPNNRNSVLRKYISSNLGGERKH